MADSEPYIKGDVENAIHNASIKTDLAISSAKTKPIGVSLLS